MTATDEAARALAVDAAADPHGNRTLCALGEFLRVADRPHYNTEATLLRWVAQKAAQFDGSLEAFAAHIDRLANEREPRS